MRDLGGLISQFISCCKIRSGVSIMGCDMVLSWEEEKRAQRQPKNSFEINLYCMGGFVCIGFIGWDGSALWYYPQKEIGCMQFGTAGDQHLNTKMSVQAGVSSFGYNPLVQVVLRTTIIERLLCQLGVCMKFRGAHWELRMYSLYLMNTGLVLQVRLACTA